MAVSQTTTNTPDQAYTLPNWFLEQNVTTAQDLRESKAQPEAPDGMQHKTFAELCDAICASFMPHNGRLGRNSTIVFRMEKQGTPSRTSYMLEPAWMSRAIMQSTKASKHISLIQLDLETLEELGSEFHQQDKQRAGNQASSPWEPKMDSFTTFLEHFFAIPSKTCTDKGSWARMHQSLSTVLAAAATARDAKIQETDGITDAVLVHIVMDRSLANETMEQRVLERFTEMVRERRQQGEAINILLSTKCLSYMPGRKCFKNIGCTEALTVTAICDEIPDSDLQNRIRIGIINTHRMRRLMKSSLPADMFCAEVLEYSSDWAAADRGKTYESFGKTIWSSDQIKKAVTLLPGRAWSQKGSSSQMSFTDIRIVLEYLNLFHQQESKPEGQTTEEPSDAEDSHHTTQARCAQESVSPATTCTPPDSHPNDETTVWPFVVSPAGQLWEQQKSQQNCHNAVLDSLMVLVGMEKPKSQFMAINNLVTTARRQNASLAEERLGAVFIGGPGSGKSTVAELYAGFLSSLQVVPRFSFEKTTGTRLASGGVAEVRGIIERLELASRDSGGLPRRRGVILIDEAHEMTSKILVFKFLMDEVRRLQGDVVFLFVGPRDEMQSFMGLSSSFRSHVPFTFDFDDFTDEELHQILVQQLHSKFRGQMLVEGGMNSVFMRTLARRIGRGRESGCFANALEVQNTLSRVLLRQAERLSSSRSRESADDMFLTQTDLLGPLPASTLKSAAWENLQDMTGIASVKKSIQALVTRLRTNFERELAEEPLLETSLNKVFLGGPGTGKTTVAKYYGQILAELGLLSNGEVIVKNCQDFIGVCTGESEEQTRRILDSAKGRVLIIEEAYGLMRNKDSDSIIDTIVANVQATSTEDRAVLLLGYKEEMEEMFREVNPGLARRFPISSAFEFQDFTDEELRMILERKLKSQGFIVSEEAKQVAMGVLSRARNRANFGNAGEVDILLDRAKEAQQIRLDGSNSTSTPLLTELKEVDFDPEIDRRSRAESNTQEDFADLVGAEALVAQFQGYQRIAKKSKSLGLDPKELIPFNFVFRGPPGTGKTTAARKLGRIFFDMGFLATKDVEISSATDLIGKYHAETGLKTKGVFEKAVGKVLLIDEAYRLGEADWNCDGQRRTSHAKEAVDEMVNLLTLPKYKNNIVVILAGYDREMNQLMATNPGLGSRFSEVVQFPSLSPKHCYELFVQLLSDKKLGVSSLHHPSVAAEVQARFQTLSNLPNWGNARDVENLAKSLFGKLILGSSTSLDVAPECVYDGMTKMIAERRKRAEDARRR